MAIKPWKTLKYFFNSFHIFFSETETFFLRLKWHSAASLLEVSFGHKKETNEDGRETVRDIKKYQLKCCVVKHPSSRFRFVFLYAPGFKLWIYCFSMMTLLAVNWIAVEILCESCESCGDCDTKLKLLFMTTKCIFHCDARHECSF